MSGGAFDYIYYRIEEIADRMGDREVGMLVHDLAELAHDREWCLSGDTSDESYEKSLAKFRAKWLAGSKAANARHKQIIEDSLQQLRDELMKIVDTNNPEK